MDYDILRGTKNNLYCNLYENIPFCFKQKKYVNFEVESIPKENEIILMRINGVMTVMSIFKVVYFDWKIFVIVNNKEGDLRSMGAESKEEVPKLAENVI